MKPADDFHDLGHALFEWSAYDPAVKVDLHAHALVVDDRLFFVDPIPLRPAAMDELLGAAGGAAAPAAVLLSNGNHARAAETFRRKFGVPVLADPGAHAALAEDGLKTDGAFDGATAGGGLQFLTLAGFVPGETVVYQPAEGGTLRIGDALIHLPAPYGFSILPDKYCADPKEARRSLRALLDVPFERLLFAHGTPILTGARGKFEALLAALTR